MAVDGSSCVGPGVANVKLCSVVLCSSCFICGCRATAGEELGWGGIKLFTFWTDATGSVLLNSTSYDNNPLSPLVKFFVSTFSFILVNLFQSLSKKEVGYYNVNFSKMIGTIQVIIGPIQQVTCWDIWSNWEWNMSKYSVVLMPISANISQVLLVVYKSL